MAHHSKTFLFGIQRDVDTNSWFFIIFEKPGVVEFESEPLYEEEEQAEQAANEWIMKNKL